MQSSFLFFSSSSLQNESRSFCSYTQPHSTLESLSLRKYIGNPKEYDDFFYDSTRVLKAKDMESRKQQPPAPSFKLQIPEFKKPSRLKHKPQYMKDKRVGKNKKSCLRIGVHESSDGVVLDLRQLRAKRKRIMKHNSFTSSKSVVLREGNFPALLLLKNHSLAHNSVKLFLRQMLDRYSDSLELIIQSNQIGCLPPPDQFIFEEQDISFSDSETFVDEQDWFMEVESQHYYIEANEAMDVLCVEDLQYFSEMLGLEQEQETSLIDL